MRASVFVALTVLAAGCGQQPPTPGNAEPAKRPADQATNPPASQGAADGRRFSYRKDSLDRRLEFVLGSMPKSLDQDRGAFEKFGGYASAEMQLSAAPRVAAQYSMTDDEDAVMVHLLRDGILNPVLRAKAVADGEGYELTEFKLPSGQNVGAYEVPLSLLRKMSAAKQAAFVARFPDWRYDLTEANKADLGEFVRFVEAVRKIGSAP